MRQVVLDASVVLRWFWRAAGTAPTASAESLRAELTSGELRVTVPPLFYLEALNVAARRWKLPGDALAELVTTLRELPFGVEEADLARIAHWAARGLTAYDASYVALAEARRVPLVTADERILAVAPEVAQALGR